MRREHASDSERTRKPPAPTRREVVQGLAQELGTSGIESPHIEAERLVAHALGVDRTQLVTDLGRRVVPEEAGRLATLARRRIAGEPLQHIEGTVPFRDNILLADSRALIPRPETEQLVEKVLEWARAKTAPGGALTRNESSRSGFRTEGVLRVRRSQATASRRPAHAPYLGLALDVGTGSGAIALSLVTEAIAARVVGIDVSPEALAQATENRARARLTEKQVELRQVEGSLWSAVGPEERFDAIVSNPPYVADAERERLATEIRDHEPRTALAGGPKGLDVIREIAGCAAQHLNPRGALFLEIGAAQGRAVRKLLEENGPWRSVEVSVDFAGRDRFVRAEPKR